MDALELTRKVAANPHVKKMVGKQQAMRKRFEADYGPEFYVPNCTEEELADPTTQLTRWPGERGVSRWTVAEEAEYNALTARLSAYRATLRELYSAK